jgi:hypothetical protein
MYNRLRLPRPWGYLMTVKWTFNLKLCYMNIFKLYIDVHVQTPLRIETASLLSQTGYRTSS